MACSSGSTAGTTIKHSTFTGNNATAANGGGGVFEDGPGAASTLIYNRIVGDKDGGSTGVLGTGVVSNRGASGGNAASSATATDNWWGCNSNPGPSLATGCDNVEGTDNGSETHSPWLVLGLSADATNLLNGGTAHLTAPCSKTRAITPIGTSDLSALLDLPIAFNGNNGSISMADTTIQTTGTAVATFTNGSTCANSSASATVNNATPATQFTTLCPDLTATLADNMSGSVPLSTSSWTWTVTVANTNSATTAPAVFTSGQTIFSDSLPGTNVSYVNVTAGTFTSITNSGNISCGVASNLLTCTASDASVTIGAGGSFKVAVTATATAAGSYANPTSGVCKVNPNNDVTERNESNNTCSDTVTVVAPPTIGKAFGGSSIQLGGTTTLTFTLKNINSATILSGVAFSDTFTGGLQVASIPGLVNNCGGSVGGATATSTGLSVGPTTIVAGGSCTISLNVTGTTQGTVSNTTNVINLGNGGTGATSNKASLLVYGPATQMAVNAGNNQTAMTGAAFATALSVTVEDSSNDPVPGVTVTFTAPATEASGTFANNTATTRATTGANGVATATTFTANATGGGPYKVVENAPGPLTVSFMLTNTAPTVMVPSVVGDTQSAATSAITGIGLVVGTPVTQQTSTTIAPGIVISQNPVANTTAIRDHPVR